MKYRVRLDLSFDSEADAKALMSYVRIAIPKSLNINIGKLNAETSFCMLEQCYHDEGGSCKLIDKVEAN